MSPKPSAQPHEISLPRLNRPQALLSWGIVLLALVTRVAWLDLKPPHFDEGVNGWFVEQMLQRGFYHYDPSNFHGPLHFYLLHFFQTLFGGSIEIIRLPGVLANVATAWLILQFRRFLPWRVCAFAALAFAISPGMIYFSRHGIHESEFVFGMALAVWGAAELWKNGTANGLRAAVFGSVILLLTKETHLIHFASFLLAMLVLCGLEGVQRIFFQDKKADFARPAPRQYSWGTLCKTFGVAALLLLFFFSGGFLDPAPAKELFANFFKAFAIWTNTGVGETGHDKPQTYWLLLMLRYEWPALLGLIWSLWALGAGMSRLTRWLAIYGGGVFVAYSLVPYKTPWCIISILWPMFFLFGDLMDRAVTWVVSKTPAGSRKIGISWLCSAVCGVALLASAGTATVLNYLQPTEPTELKLEAPKSVTHFLPGVLERWFDGHSKLKLPSYVYVQTTQDYFVLTNALDALLQQNPTAERMSIHLFLSSSYPLPWTLRRYQNVAYCDEEAKWPAAWDAGVIIVEEKWRERLECRLKEVYYTFPFKLRDGMDGGKIYFEAHKFCNVFPNREPDFAPENSASEEGLDAASSADSTEDADASPSPSPLAEPISGADTAPLSPSTSESQP